MRPRALALSLLLAAVAPAPARAQAPALTLVVESLPDGLQAEALRAAVEAELGVSVRLATSGEPHGPRALLVAAGRDGRASLTYRAEGEPDVDRSLELPTDAEDALESLALLSGNLARDEANELAASLRRKTKPRRSSEAQAAQPDPPRPAAQPAVAQSDAGPPTPALRWLPVGVDFLPFVGTSSAFGGRAYRTFSLNVLGGLAAGVRGIELGGLLNVSTRFVAGLQLAGVANVDAGPLAGLQLAGVLNVAAAADGAQLGPINVAYERLRGGQLGAINVAVGSDGVQAGAVNVAAGRAAGVQLGAINVAAGRLDGLQAGALNFAMGVRGMQLGAVNVSAGAVSGVQLGVVNVGGDVRGAQIGVINVARRSSFGLGLLNINGRGRTHVDAWGTEAGAATLALKHGGEHYHQLVVAGARPDGRRTEWLFGTGLGAHAPVARRLFLDVDAIGQVLVLAEAPHTPSLQVTARLILGYAAAGGFAVYAGPTFNLLATEDAAHPTRSHLPSFVLGEDRVGFAVRSLWPGATVGVQLL